MSIAAPSAIGGNVIPLEHLQLLLGAERETQLVGNLFANQAAWGNGKKLLGDLVDVASHDSIRISVVQSDGVLVQQWVVSIDEWRELPAQQNGDDLSVAGRSITVRSGTGTIRVGRTAVNRILVQRGSFTTAATNFFINAYARLYDGGLLQRRIASLRTNPSRDTVLKKRSATEPDAPVGVTFDANGHATPGSDGWVQTTDADPPGSDPIWLAAAHNPYDVLTETYSPEAWIITPGGSTYRQEFAEDESGPWQETPPVDTPRLVTRIRVNGNLVIYTIRDDTASGWHWFKTETLVANSSGDPYLIELDDTDWSAYKWIEFVIRQFVGTTQGNRRSIVIPADHIYSTGTAVDLTSAYTLNILITEFGSDWTMGSIDAFTNAITPNAVQQTMRLRFYGRQAALNQGTHIHATLGYTDDNVAFVMRGIK